MSTAAIEPRPTSLVVTIPGPPQGARRHRAAQRGGRVVTFHDDAHVSAEAYVVQRVQEAIAASPWWTRPDSEAVVVSIACYFARPARLRRVKDRNSPGSPYVGKPDADNIAKLVLDACTKAGAWRDDTQVSRLTVDREYLALDAQGNEQGNPGITLVIYRA